MCRGRGDEKNNFHGGSATCTLVLASEGQAGVREGRIGANGFRFLRVRGERRQDASWGDFWHRRPAQETQETLCQEYVLRSQRITYRIRPKDDKHPSLLPIGETAEFRIHKDKLLLRVPEADGKDREYIVLSMMPRTDVAENRAATAHANR
jgi:hypothetical protein